MNNMSTLAYTYIIVRDHKY